MKLRKVVECDGLTVTLVASDPNLWIPKPFLAEPNAEQVYQTALAFITSGAPEVLQTPWIIGSIAKDIMGANRTAKSHAEGRAFDMAPWYSERDLFSPDKTASGLAWDVLSLIVLSTLQWRQSPWVVEGDHLHVAMPRPEGYPGWDKSLKRGDVLSVPTLSPWYPLTAAAASIPQLSDSFWYRMFVFSQSQLTFSPASEQLLAEVAPTLV
jgi:hypothetical protein